MPEANRVEAPLRRLRSKAGGAADQVRVRMYRQGLGDCFLVRLPRPGGQPFSILIDCGVLGNSADAKAKMRDVVTNIIEETGGLVDLLVVTHEHWDHVSGFVQAEDLFAPVPTPGKLAVKATWFAWTEDPADALAQMLRRDIDSSLAAVRKLGAGLATLATKDGAETPNGPFAADYAGLFQAASSIKELLAFYGDDTEEDADAPDADGLGAAGNKPKKISRTRKALDIARALQTNITYVRPGQAPFSPPGLPEVRVFVLGPPQDADALRKLDPGKAGYPFALGTGTPLYAAFQALMDPTSLDAGAPFDASWGQPLERETASAFFEKHYFAEQRDEVIEIVADERREMAYPVNQDWRRIDLSWTSNLGELALNLDAATNNTSVVLAIELSAGGPVILLAADAQAGNWLSWPQLKWTIDRRTVTSRDLLARTVLYKVGHHGSHNASLKDFGIELMTRPDLAAFVPVDRLTARERNWCRMPLPSIIERLRAMTGGRVVLSERQPPRGEPAWAPTGFGDALTVDDLFFELVLPTR